MIGTTVLVVGGGPVGLTVAIDLAWRGIDVTVVELRAAGEPPNVKCNQVSARSMEIYRRLGLAKKLREGGLPADYPIDVVSSTSMTGIELSRLLFRRGMVGSRGRRRWIHHGLHPSRHTGSIRRFSSQFYSRTPRYNHAFALLTERPSNHTRKMKVESSPSVVIWILARRRPSLAIL